MTCHPQFLRQTDCESPTSLCVKVLTQTHTHTHGTMYCMHYILIFNDAWRPPQILAAQPFVTAIYAQWLIQPAKNKVGININLVRVSNCHLSTLLWHHDCRDRLWIVCQQRSFAISVSSYKLYHLNLAHSLQCTVASNCYWCLFGGEKSLN